MALHAKCEYPSRIKYAMKHDEIIMYSGIEFILKNQKHFEIFFSVFWQLIEKKK